MGFGSSQITKKFGRRDRGFLKLFDNLFLLDLFPNPAVAYSLRRLSSNYFGSAIRVQRMSDDAEMDIGFLSDGNLDTATLLSFVGASDGEVTIFYDQSRNTINLDVVPVSEFTPRIVIGGVLQTRNDLPSLSFRVTDILQTIQSFLSPVSHIFIFALMGINSLNNPINFNLNAPIEGDGEFSTRMFDSGNAVIWNAGNTGTEQLISPANVGDFSQHLLALIKTAGTDNQKILLDGIEIRKRTQISSSNILGKLILGNSKEGSSNGTDMNFQEFIFYDTDQLANLPLIQSNILNYWKHHFLVTADGKSIITADGKKIVVI